jgi:hypothetical protein
MLLRRAIRRCQPEWTGRQSSAGIFGYEQFLVYSALEIEGSAFCTLRKDCLAVELDVRNIAPALGNLSSRQLRIRIQFASWGYCELDNAPRRP